MEEGSGSRKKEKGNGRSGQGKSRKNGETGNGSSRKAKKGKGGQEEVQQQPTSKRGARDEDNNGQYEAQQQPNSKRRGRDEENSGRKGSRRSGSNERRPPVSKRGGGGDLSRFKWSADEEIRDRGARDRRDRFDDSVAGDSRNGYGRDEEFTRQDGPRDQPAGGDKPQKKGKKGGGSKRIDDNNYSKYGPGDDRNYSKYGPGGQDDGADDYNQQEEGDDGGRFVGQSFQRRSQDRSRPPDSNDNPDWNMNEMNSSMRGKKRGRDAGNDGADMFYEYSKQARTTGDRGGSTSLDREGGPGSRFDFLLGKYGGLLEGEQQGGNPNEQQQPMQFAQFAQFASPQKRPPQQNQYPSPSQQRSNSTQPPMTDTLDGRAAFEALIHSSAGGAGVGSLSGPRPQSLSGIMLPTMPHMFGPGLPPNLANLANLPPNFGNVPPNLGNLPPNLMNFPPRAPPPLGHPAWATPSIWGPPPTYWGPMGPPPPGHPAWYEAMGVPIPPDHPLWAFELATAAIKAQGPGGGPPANLPVPPKDASGNRANKDVGIEPRVARKEEQAGATERVESEAVKGMAWVPPVPPQTEDKSKQQEQESQPPIEDNEGGASPAPSVGEEQEDTGAEVEVEDDGEAERIEAELVEALAKSDIPPSPLRPSDMFCVVRAKINEDLYENVVNARAGGSQDVLKLMWSDDSDAEDEVEVEEEPQNVPGTAELSGELATSTEAPGEKDVEDDDMYGDLDVQTAPHVPEGVGDTNEDDADDLYGDLYEDVDAIVERKTQKDSRGNMVIDNRQLPVTEEVSGEKAVAMLRSRNDNTRAMMSALWLLEEPLYVPRYCNAQKGHKASTPAADLVEEAISLLQASVM